MKNKENMFSRVNMTENTLFQMVMRNKEACRIVTEVKASVEWEDVQMTILEYGKEIGKEIGGFEKQVAIIRKKLNKQMTTEDIAECLEMEEAEVDRIKELLAENMDAADIEIAMLLIDNKGLEE